MTPKARKPKPCPQTLKIDPGFQGGPPSKMVRIDKIAERLVRKSNANWFRYLWGIILWPLSREAARLRKLCRRKKWNPETPQDREKRYQRMLTRPKEATP